MRRHFEHDGRIISYLEVWTPGRVEAGTLVLLHGFPLSADMWRPQLAAAPSGWRFVAPDLRGFGQSSTDGAAAPVQPPAASVPAHPPVSIADYADDVLALLDHLGVDSAVVAGVSMGGYAAFALLRAAPARVRGLVLADTRPEADNETARRSRDSMLATSASGGAAAVFERMLPGLLGATTRRSRPDVVERVRQIATGQPADAIRDAIVRMKGRPDSVPLLPGILFPVQVVVGEEDEITGVEIARYMHGQIAGAELAIIGHAGHLSNLERPDEFNMILDRFLATAFEP